MRNPNPFTERQICLLESIREKIREINDPDPEIFTHESYQWFAEQTKEFGQIPKIRFRPNSCKIKAELLERAGLLDKSREDELAQIRQRYGVREARNREARLFESEWNNIMLKAKKAMVTAGVISQLFATDNQIVSDPVKLLQSIIMHEYASQIIVKREPIHPSENRKPDKMQKSEEVKRYDQELMNIESSERS